MIVYSTCRTCGGLLHVTDNCDTHPLCEPQPAIQLAAHPRLGDAALFYVSKFRWPVFPIWEKGRKIGVSITECRCGHNISYHRHLDAPPGKCRWIDEDNGDYCVCQDFVGKPILATGKQPATAHGFKDATDDHHRIRAWWERHPNCNIGIPTGVRFDVIDIDLPDGPESYAQMIEDDLIPDVHGQVDTASGGRHLYIEPTGDGCTARLRPGIDYRGKSGYCVLPPSVLGESSWKWVTYPSPVIAGKE